MMGLDQWQNDFERQSHDPDRALQANQADIIYWLVAWRTIAAANSLADPSFTLEDAGATRHRTWPCSNLDYVWRRFLRDPLVEGS